MHRIAAGMVAAGACAAALSAQSAPPRTPAARPANESALNEFMNRYGRLARGPQKLGQVRGMGEPAVCSIPLREVPVSRKGARMPVLRPGGGPDSIDRMPAVKLPAPPCGEEKR